RLQIARLADVEHLGGRVEHAVDPRAAIKQPQIVLNHLISAACHCAHGLPRGLSAGICDAGKRQIPKITILLLRCNEPEPRARGKKSTVSVDKFAEKLW